MDTSKYSLEDWLKHEFEFDEEDLIANRKGIMSNRQKSRAIRGGTALFLTAIGSGVLLVVIGGGVIGQLADYLDCK